MLALAAEHPHGLGVVNHDSVDRDHAHVCAGLNRLEARVHALHAGVDVGDGHAGVVEVGLSDGVVTGPELELNHGSRLGGDLIGPELDVGLVAIRVHTDGDNLDVHGYE